MALWYYQPNRENKALILRPKIIIIDFKWTKLLLLPEVSISSKVRNQQLPSKLLIFLYENKINVKNNCILQKAVNIGKIFFIKHKINIAGCKIRYKMSS